MGMSKAKRRKIRHSVSLAAALYRTALPMPQPDFLQSAKQLVDLMPRADRAKLKAMLASANGVRDEKRGV
jgi:hypothetical protein